MIDYLLVFALLLTLIGLAMPTIVQLTAVLKSTTEAQPRALPLRDAAARRDVVTLGDCLRITANG